MTKTSILLDAREPEAMKRLAIKIVPRPKCWPEGFDWQMRPITDERGHLGFKMHIRFEGGDWRLATDSDFAAFHFHCEGDTCRQPPESVN